VRSAEAKLRTKSRRLSVDDYARILVASFLEASHAELLALVRPRLLLGDARPPSRVRIVVLMRICRRGPPIRALLPCKARGKSVTIAPPLSNRVIVPGSIPQSFGVDAIGNAVASLSLTVAPSRGPQPATATGRLSSDAATARPVDDHFLTASLEFAYHFRDEARHEPL